MSIPARLIACEASVPAPMRAVLRGVGQVFFQGNALTGACFLVGIALSSPLMAVGGLIGAVIGTALALLLRWDAGEAADGIYGFNPTLVGIATFFFFQPGVMSVVLLAVGCVAATFVTYLMRRRVPFPTYTTPFIVTNWALYFIGLALKVAEVEPGGPVTAGVFGATAHGISQVMFQASLWTALLFLIGIALSDWRHAAWVVAGALAGVLVGSYHTTVAVKSLGPEKLIERGLTENVALGLYGYNATLTAVALFLWRRSLIAPLLGILLSVPMTELVPMFRVPALTAPFVLATWLVLFLGWLEARFLPARGPAPS